MISDPAGRSTPIRRLLGLIGSPSETLAVLEHIRENPFASPNVAASKMRIGINTWYGAIRQLERHGLIRVDRGPTGKRAISYRVTLEGIHLFRILSFMSDLMEVQVRFRAESHVAPGSPEESSRAGSLLCEFIEMAEANSDTLLLGRIQVHGAEVGRRGETFLAWAVEALILRDPVTAARAAALALRCLATEKDARSYSKALSVLDRANKCA